MTPELHDCRFLRTVRREPVDTTPVWIMRQAGRYMPEYQALRKGHDFLDFCKRPDLAAEATLVAQQILGVDAAILFADLTPILEPMGLSLRYAPGPVIDNPLRTAADVDRCNELEDVNSLEFVFEAVRRIRRDLPADIPLLGFAGAPFTLASYAIEGAGSRNYLHAKRLMYSDEGAWNELLGKLARSVVRYLLAQIENGCQAVQIFDSWAGCLGPDDYRRYVMPHTKAVVDAVSPHAPVINFLTGNSRLLPLLRETGGQVIGLDWRVDLGETWQMLGHDVAVQGNLDPASLVADLPMLRERTQAVMDSAGGRPGHIFNLGHGVMPEVSVDNVKALVEMVHEMGAK